MTVSAYCVFSQQLCSSIICQADSFEAQTFCLCDCPHYTTTNVCTNLWSTIIASRMSRQLTQLVLMCTLVNSCYSTSHQDQSTPPSHRYFIFLYNYTMSCHNAHISPNNGEVVEDQCANWLPKPANLRPNQRQCIYWILKVISAGVGWILLARPTSMAKTNKYG